MPFKFIQKAFGIKKNVDKKNNDDFYKFYRTSRVVDLRFDTFKEECLRLLVLSLSPNEKLFDSDHPNDFKDLVSPQEYSIYFDLGQNVSPYRNSTDNISTFRIHHFKHLNKIVLSRNIKLFYNKTKDSKEFYPKINHRQVRHHVESTKNIMVCLIFNLDWIDNVRQNDSSKRTQSNSAESDETKLTQQKHKFTKLSCFIYEHFLELSVLFESALLAILENIVRLEEFSHYISHEYCIAQSPRHKVLHSREDFSLQSKKQFHLLQSSIFELCQPRLYKPVYIHLSQALTKVRKFGFDLNRDFDDQFGSSESSLNQVNPYDYLVNQFYRGCMSVLFKKAYSKDKGLFLAKIVTGVLMQNQGWIPSVLTKTDFENSFLRQDLDPQAKTFLHKVHSNHILDQFVYSNGCTPIHLYDLLSRYQKYHKSKKPDSPRDSSIPSSLPSTPSNPMNGQQQQHLPATLLANTIIHGQNKENMMALFYFLTYFLRYPTFNRKCETLPDLGRADIFELEQKKKLINFDARRKSGSAVQVGVADPSKSSFFIPERKVYAHSQSCCCSPGRYGDSGISSQEDLSGFLHNSLKTSNSHHSNVSSPGVGMISSKVCLPQRLTTDQCRLAETAAKLVVNNQMTVQNVNRQLVSESSLNQSNSLGHHYNTIGTNVNPTLRHNIFMVANQITNSSGNSSSNLRMKNKSREFLEIPLLIENCSDKSANENCFCFPEDLNDFVQPSNGQNNDNSSSLSNTTETTPSIPPTSQMSAASNPWSSVSFSTSTTALPATMAAHPAGLNHQAIIDGFLSDITPCHSYISSGVKDKFTRGVSLQATTEPLDSFQEKLCRELTDWCANGPSILAKSFPETCSQSNMNQVSNKSFDSNDEHCTESESISQNSSFNISLTPHTESVSSNPNPNQTGNTFPKDILDASLCVNSTPSYLSQDNALLARSLLINTDNRSISVYSIHHALGSSKANENNQVTNVRNSHQFSHSPSSAFHRTSASSIFSDQSKKTLHTQFKSSQTQITEPAHFVHSLLNDINSLTSKTSICGDLLLRYIEVCLQSIAQRANILAYLLAHEGNSIWSDRKRLAVIISCHVDDFPLLYRICYSNCQEKSLHGINKLDQDLTSSFMQFDMADDSPIMMMPTTSNTAYSTHCNTQTKNRKNNVDGGYQNRKKNGRSSPFTVTLSTNNSFEYFNDLNE